MGAGPADLTKALSPVHAVHVGRHQQAARAQPDAMAGADGKRGPVCREEGLLVPPMAAPPPWGTGKTGASTTTLGDGEDGGQYPG